MIEVVGLGIVVLAGVPIAHAAVLGIGVFAPLPASVAIGYMWFSGRKRVRPDAALFCENVASELRSGTSLRDAVHWSLATVTSVEPAGVPSVSELAILVAEEFPDVGVELRHSMEAAVRAGSDPALVFDEIGGFALAKSEVEGEVKIATSPAVATGMVLVGAPLAFLLFQVDSESLGRVLSQPGQRVAALVGLSLFSLGAGIAGAVLWRARS